MLTKEGFTRDEWNHLLRLLNIMNFSMFSCSHFFLSNRKQSAMSKRGQEGNSGEGSAMAKPRLLNLVIAKPRPVNLVSHNLLSMEKNSPQILSDPTNLENAKAEQGGVLTSAWKHARHGPKSSRAFSSEATGRHSKCRYMETRKEKLFFGLNQLLETDARCRDTHEHVKGGLS